MPPSKTVKPNLGRKGSVGYLFRYNILHTKKSQAAVLSDVRRKFPERDIPDTYYSWYINDLRKKGLLKR